jgi:hypothetical protein
MWADSGLTCVMSCSGGRRPPESHDPRVRREPGLLSMPGLQLAANSHRPGSRDYFPDLSLYYVQVNLETL